MHPGVVGSGLGSLVRPAAKPSRSPSPVGRLQSEPQGTGHLDHDIGSTASLLSDVSGSTSLMPVGTSSTAVSQSSGSLSVPVDDPNFDPFFPNDVRIEKRTGWSNAWHFVQKHSKDIVHASESLVTSYFEFGGALADYRALKRRYDRIRSLENGSAGARVRFVNYYTACTGRPKRVKVKEVQAKGLEEEILPALTEDLENLRGNIKSQSSTSLSSNISVNTSTEESHLDQTKPRPSGSSTTQNLAHRSRSVMPQDNETSGANTKPDDIDQLPTNNNRSDNTDLSRQLSQTAEGPATSLEPGTRSPGRLSDTTPTPDNIAAGESGHPPSGASQSPLAAGPLSSEYLQRQAEASDEQFAPEPERQFDAENPAPRNLADDLSAFKGTETKIDKEKAAGEGAGKAPKKYKKFCLLPRKVNGERDSCWVKVFMPDVDEVGAHCGLFSMKEDPQRYEMFVQDVSLRIVDWISERS